MVTNHLISVRWKDDPINRFRRDDLTYYFRALQRGEALVPNSGADVLNDPHQAEKRVLAILRDKGDLNGKPLHFGNRAAIDALIATHSVVYDSLENRFFVSQGPSLVGPFVGFDLKESFRTHQPVVIPGFPHDPALSDERYSEIKQSFKDLSEAEHLIRKKQCEAAQMYLDSAKAHYSESYGYAMALGDEKECLGDLKGAVAEWKVAQARYPAYANERKYLARKIAKEDGAP